MADNTWLSPHRSTPERYLTALSVELGTPMPSATSSFCSGQGRSPWSGARHELILGMSVDSTFGPLMMFGAGGTAERSSCMT